MPASKRPIVVLGNFDGVHRGHRALLRKAASLAAEDGASVLVWTFDSLPTPAITETALRRELLLAYGADDVLFDAFKNVKDLSPRQFVEQILRDKLGAEAAVCGYNYSFGRHGSGDAALLSALCAEYGIACHTVDRVTLDGEEISSTRIRELLAAGELDRATALLGHPYLFRGEVVPGQALGRTIGIPTVNFTVDRTVCLPKRGVYASFCYLPDGRIVPAVTNVGYRPTVSEDEITVIETHLLDFSGDLYGVSLPVGLLSYLREEKKFPSLDALREAISFDSHRAREVFHHYSFSEI